MILKIAIVMGAWAALCAFLVWMNHNAVGPDGL
jgi:hypothetical protein